MANNIQIFNFNFLFVLSLINSSQDITIKKATANIIFSKDIISLLSIKRIFTKYIINVDRYATIRAIPVAILSNALNRKYIPAYPMMLVIITHNICINDS